MPLSEPLAQILAELVDAGVEFVVIGGCAAVMQDAAIVTFDLDIVHRRTPENADRLLAVLDRIDGHFRPDFAGRRIKPKQSDLLGHGHILLQTKHGKFDALCEITNQRGYEELLPHTREVEDSGLRLRVLGLPMLIQVKTEAGRPKDLAAIPQLIAALEASKGGMKR